MGCNKCIRIPPEKLTSELEAAGLHTSDCQVFMRRFRSTSFDRAANLEPIFPDSELDHLEAKFDALIIHRAPPCPTS